MTIGFAGVATLILVGHGEVYLGSEAHNRHVTTPRKIRLTNHLWCHLGFTRIALTFGRFSSILAATTVLDQCFSKEDA